MEDKIEVAIPLSRPEKTTDFKSLMVFFISTILYTGIAIYAFSNYNPTKINDEIANNQTNSSYSIVIFELASSQIINPIIEYYINFCNYLQSLGWYISIFLVVLLSSSVLCIFIIQRASTCLIATAMIFLYIFVGVIITSFFLMLQSFKLDRLSILIYVIVCLIFFFSTGSGSQAVCITGILAIEEVIKESCRAIRASPFLILWTFLSNILSFGVMILTYNVFVMLRINDSTALSQHHLEILRYLNLFIGIWIINFIFAVNRIVCSRTFSTWFYTASKSDFSNRTSADSIIITIRYYLGTAAYASSFLSIIESALLLNRLVISFKPENSKRGTIAIFFNYLNIVFTLPKGSSITTAMQGTNFNKSSYSALQAYCSNFSRLYGINKGLSYCILASYFFIITLSGLLVIFVKADFLNLKDAYIISIFTIHSTIITAALIESAVLTISLCIFKELEYEKQNLARPSFMSDKLKELMLPKSSDKKINLESV